MVVIATVVAVHFETRITDKSIAVLPFKYLGDDPDMQYLADGMMDAICQELDVAFFLEGSFTKYGDRVKLFLTLIEPRKEGHIWAKEYDRNWTDIFSVQSEVSQAVARELQAVITPEEKQLIDKVPTTSLTAYDFFQRGREEQIQYWLDNDNRDALERAKDFYYRTLEYDSTFAQAYTGLAWVYQNKHFFQTFLSENFLDSMLVLADIALSFDDKLAEAYIIRGDYFRFKKMQELAIIEYDKAIKFNPNEWQAYWNKARVYYKDDYVQEIFYLLKAVSLHRGPLLPRKYIDLAVAYQFAGFKDKRIYYAKERYKLTNDSARYYGGLGGIEETFNNFEKAIEFYGKSLAIDSTNWWYSLRLGMVYSYIDRYEEYLEYLKNMKKYTGNMMISFPIGFFILDMHPG